MYERHDGDDILSEDPRLKYKWEWCRIASGYNLKELENWTHFQSSEAEVGNGWKLEVSQWGGEVVYYRYQIEYVGSHMASNYGDKSISTRIEAQIKCEELLVMWITGEYDFIIKGVKKDKDNKD